MYARFYYSRTFVFIGCTLIALVGLTGCDDSGNESTTRITVMTRNLYLGGDLMVVLGADTPQEVPDRVADLYQDVVNSRFRERVVNIVDEIEQHGPDLIGLQEVALFRTQTPGDYLSGTTTPNATTITYDFLALLQSELDARDLDYVVAVESENADVELSAAMDDGTVTDVRLTDRDVILTKSGFQIAVRGGAPYTTNMVVPLGGSSGTLISLLRGYQWITTSKDGIVFSFFNSHLEVGGVASAVQEAQARALIHNVLIATGPVLVAGDFNSAADGSTTDSYELLTERLTDAYTIATPGGAGYTCCQEADLFNAASTLSERIDLILFRGDVEVESASRTGYEPADRTVSGRWPSDHAGVVATLLLKQ